MAKTLERVKKVSITTVVELDGDIEERVMTVTVKKAPLGKWKRLTDSIKKLFELLPEILEKKGVEDPEKYIEKMGPQDLLMLIPDMLEVATEEVINILALGADTEPEYIEKHVGLDEAIEIFEAIIEVNNLIKVVEKGKNLMALWGAGQRAAKNLKKRK